jgi:uncharacterized protein (DUF433 family)
VRQSRAREARRIARELGPGQGREAYRLGDDPALDPHAPNQERGQSRDDKLGGLGETARELAYRLYSICERKKGAHAALAHNRLAIAWPELSKRALSRKTRQPSIQQEMFWEAFMRLTRITINPTQMGGVPCIRGLRIPVATVVSMIAEGMSHEEILRAYPDLEAEDIREALALAAEALRERELPLVRAP